jgi:AraC family transcriptional regulator
MSPTAPAAAPSTFPVAETHGIALWPGFKLFAHSEGLGWQDVYASLAAERSWTADLKPVRHYCFAYCLHQAARIRRTVEGKEWRHDAILKPRTFGVVPADRLSHWTVDGRPEVLLVYLRRSMVDDLAAEMFDLEAKDIELQPMLGDSDPLLEQLALAFLGALRRRERDSDGLYVDSLGRMAAMQILRHHAMRGGKPAARAEDTRALPPGMRRVRDFIEASLDAELGLKRLAREAGVSAHTLPRAFLRAFGETPHRFVLNRRLDRARELLAGTDMPVVDIALATGFSSQSHLAAAFRQLTGLTPGEYRKERGRRAE